MYIFTPNTLIESSKVNSNFDEVSNKLELNDTFRFRCNSGGGRSATTSTNWAAVPGWSSNTITPTLDGTIYGHFTMMSILGTAADAQFALYVNGVSKLTDFGGMYVTQTVNWTIQTIPFELDVTAGVAYTLAVYWRVGSGATLTVCNGSGDGQFPTEITGILVSRG